MRIVILLLLSVLPAFAITGGNRIWSWCEQGNQTITVLGYTSSAATPVQRSYSACTITVYISGTFTLDTIYSDQGLTTPLANPFTANANGYWFYYNAGQCDDVQLSGAGIPTPFTLGSLCGSALPNSGVATWNGRTGNVVPLSGDYSCAQVTGCNSILGVTTWNSRSGAVVPLTNDYTYSQIGGPVQGNTTKPQMAGTNSGVTGATLCNDAGGNSTTSGCTSPFPSGTQTQFLRIQPNTGNNTTLQFSTPSVLSVPDFNWPPQSPGGTLTAGVGSSITLSPVPLGVSAAASNLYVYLSAGVGTAEACLVTGGTAVPGASSGTVICTPANNHSGAWTVQSASAGAKECLVAAVANNGSCYFPAGNYNQYASLYNDTLLTTIGTFYVPSMWGDGPSSVLNFQCSSCGVVVGNGGAINFAAASISKLRAVYSLGGFDTVGDLWKFQNLSIAQLSELESKAGNVGFHFLSVVGAWASGLFSDANNKAFWFSGTASNGNAGLYTNLSGFTQANGTMIQIDPIIQGLTLNGVNITTGGASTKGLVITPSSLGPINELVVANGFIDNNATAAFVINYTNTATPESPGNTIHLNNIRFTNSATSPNAVGILNAGMFGIKIENCTFLNTGTGDGVTFAGTSRVTFSNNTVDVVNAGGRPLVFQAGSGGEVNSNILLSGNLVGFNGAPPTNSVVTDGAAHTGITFVGNKLNSTGGMVWSATGVSNIFDLSNQVVPAITFATLPSFSNGSSLYCSNCTSTCGAGAGTGRTCFRENGAWTH